MDIRGLGLGKKTDQLRKTMAPGQVWADFGYSPPLPGKVPGEIVSSRPAAKIFWRNALD